MYIEYFNIAAIPQGQRSRTSDEKNVLGILRVCRSINDEAKDLWRPRISFDFDDTSDFVRFFAITTADKGDLVRHAKISVLGTDRHYPHVYRG